MSRVDLSPAFMELTVPGEGDLHQECVSPREEPWLRNTGHWEGEKGRRPLAQASVFSLWGGDLGLNLGSATSSVLFSESFCFRGVCKGTEVGA